MKVCVRQPDRFSSQRGDELVDTVDPAPIRHSCNDPQADVPGSFDGIACRYLPGAKRRSDCAPDLGERTFRFGYRGPFDLDPSVTPCIDFPFRIANLLLTDTKAGDEGKAPVHPDHLSMVSIDPAQRTVDTWRVETADIDSVIDHLPPEAAGSIATPPAQSYINRTFTPSFALAASKSANCHPISSSWMINVSK